MKLLLGTGFVRETNPMDEMFTATLVDSPFPQVDHPSWEISLGNFKGGALADAYCWPGADMPVKIFYNETPDNVFITVERK